MSIVAFTMNPAIDVSASVARVLPTHKLRCTSVRRDAGGGINVARVIARLGGPLRALYPVGGPIGDLLKRRMDAEAVASNTIPLSQDTRESFTLEEGETGQQYRFVPPGPELTDAECGKCLAAVAHMRPAPDFFVASGSLPAGVPDDFLARAAPRATKALGAKVVVDTSGPALAAVLEEGVFLIKPNLREMQELVGTPLAGREQQLAAARDLVAKGAADIVALTLGHLGCLLVTQRQAFYAPALPVRPVSAVGAGDSFLGAMVWSLDAGWSVEEASGMAWRPGRRRCSRRAPGCARRTTCGVSTQKSAWSSFKTNWNTRTLSGIDHDQEWPLGNAHAGL